MGWPASKNTANPGGRWGGCVLCGAGGEGEIPGKVEDTGEPGTAAGLRRAAPTVAGTKVAVPLDPWALSEARWLAGEALGLARSSLGES